MFPDLHQIHNFYHTQVWRAELAGDTIIAISMTTSTAWTVEYKNILSWDRIQKMPGMVVRTASEVVAVALIIRGKCAENWAGSAAHSWGSMTTELEREA